MDGIDDSSCACRQNPGQAPRPASPDPLGLSWLIHAALSRNNWCYQCGGCNPQVPALLQHISNPYITQLPFSCTVTAMTL